MARTVTTSMPLKSENIGSKQAPDSIVTHYGAQRADARFVWAVARLSFVRAAQLRIIKALP
jgi:hypothetical protein